MGSLIPNCCAYKFSETDHYVYLANTKEFYKCMNKLLAIADKVSASKNTVHVVPARTGETGNP